MIDPDLPGREPSGPDGAGFLGSYIIGIYLKGTSYFGAYFERTLFCQRGEHLMAGDVSFQLGRIGIALRSPSEQMR
jgi:hypothetical protein